MSYILIISFLFICPSGEETPSRRASLKQWAVNVNCLEESWLITSVWLSSLSPAAKSHYKIAATHRIFSPTLFCPLSYGHYSQKTIAENGRSKTSSHGRIFLSFRALEPVWRPGSYEVSLRISVQGISYFFSQLFSFQDT